MPQAPDHLMKETLYMKIIHLLDRHRTWLEIESIATVRNHTIVRNGRMTDILSRVLVVKAIHHHFPYTRGQVWQIAEYDLEQAIKSLRFRKISEAFLFFPQISQMLTDFRPVRSGISQIFIIFVA